MRVSKSVSLNAVIIIQGVNARDAEHTARAAYADALAHGRPHPEARRAYFVALRQHAPADPQP
jgi:uncharacterized protein (TIGR02996 family)